MFDHKDSHKWTCCQSFSGQHDSCFINSTAECPGHACEKRKITESDCRIQMLAHVSMGHLCFLNVKAQKTYWLVVCQCAKGWIQSKYKEWSRIFPCYCQKVSLLSRYHLTTGATIRGPFLMEGRLKGHIPDMPDKRGSVPWVQHRFLFFSGKKRCTFDIRCVCRGYFWMLVPDPVSVCQKCSCISFGKVHPGGCQGNTKKQEWCNAVM